MKQLITSIILLAPVACGNERSSTSEWRSGHAPGTTEGSEEQPAGAIMASLRETLRRLEDQERDLASRPATEEAVETLRARARDIRARLQELEQRAEVGGAGTP